MNRLSKASLDPYQYRFQNLIRTITLQHQTQSENQVWIPFGPVFEDVSPLETKSSGDGASNLKGAIHKLKRKCQTN